MSHTKVPSLDDDPNAISTIDDDFQSLFNNPIDQSVRPSPTISSNRFVEPIYHTRVRGLVSQDSEYESNSIAGRSEGSKGSKDSGYESAHSFRELGYGGSYSGYANTSNYYPARVGRLQGYSDIDLFSTYESLQEHSDTASASSTNK